jgi:hypothetical protein
MTRYTHGFLTRVVTVEGHDGFSGATADRGRDVKKKSAVPHAGKPAGGVQGQAWPGLPLSVPELRRRLWRLVLAVPQTARHILAWSEWRRRHQTIAQYDHDKRREALVGAMAA